MRAFPVRLADAALVGPLRPVPDDFAGWSVAELAAAGDDPRYADARWRGIGFWPAVDDPPAFDPATEARSGPAWQPDAETKTVVASYAVAGRPLAALKAAKVAAIDARRDAVLALGAPFAGKRIKVDDAARADIGGMGATALAVLVTAAGETPIPWPDDYALGWIAIDNERVAMPTPAIGLALGAACGAYYAKAVQNARTLKDQALSAADTAALALIDVDAGWPE